MRVGRTPEPGHKPTAESPSRWEVACSDSPASEGHDRAPRARLQARLDQLAEPPDDLWPWPLGASDTELDR